MLYSGYLPFPMLGKDIPIHVLDFLAKITCYYTFLCDFFTEIRTKLPVRTHRYDRTSIYDRGQTGENRGPYGPQN